MLTRRAAVTTVGALGAFSLTTRLTRFSALGRAPTETVDFEVPRGACDAHVHIISDPKEFPMSPGRDYTPPMATADELLQALKALSFDRAVIVTPTIYGADNSVTLAAIKQLGRDCVRGVALVDETTSSRTLDLMMEAGITGTRLFPYGGGVLDVPVAAKHLKFGFDLAERRGWHLEISAPPDVIAALLTQLRSSPVPLVLDAFGWVAGGVQQPGFDAVLSLVNSGRAYVKLAEPYRLSKKAPDYQDLMPVVQAFLSANPDRLLWGSGWPHVDSAAS